MAKGISRPAELSSQVDQPEGERWPFLPWDKSHQITLDFLRIRVLGKAKAPCNPSDMRIHDNPKSILCAWIPSGPAFQACGAQDDICRLTAYAVESQELLHRTRDFPFEAFHQGSAGVDDGPRFLAVETGGANECL